MKLKISDIEYAFDLNSISEYIICENFQKFINIIQSVLNEDEDNILIVNENYEKCDCINRIKLINDYYNYDMESSKLISDFIKKDKNYFFNEEYKEEENKLSLAIVNYLNYLKVEFPLNIKYEDSLNIDYLLKSYSVTFESNDNESLKLIDYCVLQNAIYQKKIMFFININNYFHLDDIIQIRKELKNKGIDSIVLSSNDYQLKEKEGIIKIYLDKDLCEFYSK